MAIKNAEMVALEIIRALGVPAYVTPPTERPSRYVRLARVGGTFQNRVTDSATIAISCYSRDAADAAELSAECRQALVDARGTFRGGAWVRWWIESAGPSNYPDPDVNLTRYQFTGELRLSTN